MNATHITAAYDRDLEDLQARIMKMAGLVEQAIQDAARSLETRDVELAEEVRARDKRIDALEREIGEATALLIARRAPTASDLRLVLAVLKIAASLERIGDFAKNMAKRTGVLVQLPAINGSGPALRRMASEVDHMLTEALEAYLKRDAGQAEAVIARDIDVDQMYNALFREFLTFMMEDPRNISPCMHLHFIAKNIERMGDHVTSIAEQTIYLVTGESTEEARERKDRTSTDAGMSGVAESGGA